MKGNVKTFIDALPEFIWAGNKKKADLLEFLIYFPPTIWNIHIQNRQKTAT